MLFSEFKPQFHQLVNGIGYYCTPSVTADLTPTHPGFLLVRFPNPLATGSGLGFQCPKKWEIFL